MEPSEDAHRLVVPRKSPDRLPFAFQVGRLVFIGSARRHSLYPRGDLRRTYKRWICNGSAAQRPTLMAAQGPDLCEELERTFRHWHHPIANKVPALRKPPDEVGLDNLAPVVIAGIGGTAITKDCQIATLVGPYRAMDGIM